MGETARILVKLKVNVSELAQKRTQTTIRGCTHKIVLAPCIDHDCTRPSHWRPVVWSLSEQPTKSQTSEVPIKKFHRNVTSTIITKDKAKVILGSAHEVPIKK